jgi:hypothetical protein
MELLNVDIRLSTAFHPQTNGQTERVNQVLEQYLRSYCSYQQDDWTELLPFAGHTYNLAVSESTKMPPFKANNGFSPYSNWPEVEMRKHDNIGSTEQLEDWTLVWREQRDNIDKAQMRQRKW